MTQSHVSRLILIFIIFCFASGCAHKPPFQQVSDLPKERAVVYLYRPDVFRGGAITPPVYIDRKEIFDLESGSYAVFELAPGKHVIETRKSGILTSDAVGEIEIDVESSKEYFLKWLPYTTYFGVSPVPYALFVGTFYPMEKDKALVEISECWKIYPRIVEH